MALPVSVLKKLDLCLLSSPAAYGKSSIVNQHKNLQTYA